MTADGKTILVTGSTDGVGRCVAKKLAIAGAHVLIHGRNTERAATVLREIRDSGGTASFYQANFASLAEVRELAETIEQTYPRLDVLVNNAGLGVGPQNATRELSQDGHELRFSVNYLASYLLTRRLLPLLRSSAPARIVNVASAGQEPIEFDNVMLTRGYSGWRAYCQSKLALVMFTLDLADELEQGEVTANCLHPATFMDTSMVREAGVSPVNTVETGAEAICRLAVASDTDGRSGLYFDGLRQSRPNRQAFDLTARQRLRQLSSQLIDA